MIEPLNNLRDRLVSEGRYTDAVDEVLIKVANAKTKRFKITDEDLIMEKYITDEHTGLKYELVGDYYLIAGDDERKKGSQSGHGGSGTSAISRSIAVCDMPTF